MREVWNKSTEMPVSATSCVAIHTPPAADQVNFAGSVHQIGVLPILITQYAEEQ
jgi:HD-like signal output (HDOD) protein